jgi:hypothetical protein
LTLPRFHHCDVAGRRVGAVAAALDAAARIARVPAFAALLPIVHHGHLRKAGAIDRIQAKAKARRTAVALDGERRGK